LVVAQEQAQEQGKQQLQKMKNHKMKTV